MGTLYEGSFSGGWRDMLTGEALHEPLETEQLPLYQRGPLGLRASERAEIENKITRAASEVTVFDAFAEAGRSLGMSEERIAEMYAEVVRPIPEPAMTVACREGHHFAPDYPAGCCTGKRLADDYTWHHCECKCHTEQEVKLP